MADPTHPLVTESTVTPARVLRDAADYLIRHGWVQGSYYDQTATVFTPAACVVGAIGMVCYGGPVDAPALNFDAPEFGDFDAAVSFLDVELKASTGLDVYGWNDHPQRTAEDVTRVLRDAATAWEVWGDPGRPSVADRSSTMEVAA